MGKMIDLPLTEEAAQDLRQVLLFGILHYEKIHEQYGEAIINARTIESLKVTKANLDERMKEFK